MDEGNEIKSEIYPPDLMNSEMKTDGGNNIFLDCKSEVGVKNEDFDLNIKCEFNGPSPFDIEDASTKEELMQQTPLDHGKIYKCKYCSYSSTNEMDLMQHMIVGHEANKTITKNDLQRHIHVLLQCDECEKTFRRPDSLKNHKMTHSSVRSFSCKECDKSFKLRTTLSNHMRIHIGKTFPCDVCGNSFSRATTLKAHKRIHTGERPYQCDECDQSFRLYDSLVLHKEKHSGKRDYMCEICSKTFYSRVILKVHMKRHANLKTNVKYDCQECGKGYTQKCHLTNHIRMKHGNFEKKFGCEHCGKLFSYNSGLKDHMKIHTGDKPYTCPTCYKGFTNSSNLNVHQLNHSGELPFKCTVCSQGFKVLVQLKRHMVKIHEMEYTPPTLPTTFEN